MKSAKIILSLLVASAVLTGCATTTGGTKPVAEGTTLINPKEKSLEDGMSASDKSKLLELVSSSRPDTSEKWGTYDFTSIRVFVNDNGQACREYKVSSFFSSSQQIACRSSSGVWKVVNQF